MQTLPSSENVWKISDAKTHLSEILRRSTKSEPQYIGIRKSHVVVPADVWHLASQKKQTPHMGKWLIDNIPRGSGLEKHIPPREKCNRRIPFIDQ